MRCSHEQAGGFVPWIVRHRSCGHRDRCDISQIAADENHDVVRDALERVDTLRPNVRKIVTADQIASLVRDRISNRIDKTVFIKSDGRAKYGDVVKLVDEVRSAGVDNVGLLTDKAEQGRTPPPPPVRPGA